MLSTLSASASKVTLKYSGLDISDMYDLVRWWSIEVGEMYKIGNNRSKLQPLATMHLHLKKKIVVEILPLYWTELSGLDSQARKKTLHSEGWREVH